MTRVVLSSLLAHFLLLTACRYTNALPTDFDQFEACNGQDSIVMASDADKGADPFNGWFAYSGSLIFCCEGMPYAVTCSEIMLGYCSCPVDPQLLNKSLEEAIEDDYEPVITCYARECGMQVSATAINEGRTAQCYLPSNATLNGQGFTNNKTVSAHEFCRAYGNQMLPVPPPVNDDPSVLGAFETIPNPDLPDGRSSTGIVPVHMVMLPPTNRVVMWSRGQQPNWPAEPNVDWTVSVVYDWATGQYWPVPIDSSPFCSGVGFSATGNVLAFGGEQGDAPWGTPWQPTLIKDGRNLIREFDVNSYEWKTLEDKLPGNHWYPTQTLLQDGRVLNQGGFKSMVGPQNEQFDIFDSNTNELVTYFNSTPFAQNRSIMNLYPFFSYLPYTDQDDPDLEWLFMDLCNHAEMYTIDKENNLVQKAVLPQMGGDDDYCAAFSAVGFSRFLPFKPPYDKPEYVAFGGIYNSTAEILALECWADITGSDKSFRVGVNPRELMAGGNGVTWEMETMPFKRVGGLAVLLPNGKVLIMNGAESGAGNDYLRTPVRTAVMYDPDAPSGERYTTLATSPIKRLYHNVAILLPTGNVLVAGGEQGEAFSDATGPWCGTTFDYTFEAELYKPPYVFQPDQRPRIVSVQGGHEKDWGETLTILYTGPSVDSATITSPPAVTHGLDMNSRTAFLELIPDDDSACAALILNSTDTQKCSHFKMPLRSHRVTRSGWHMLFINNGEFPCHEATWINIQDADDEEEDKA